MLMKGIMIFGLVLVLIFLVMSFLSKSKANNSKSGTIIDIEKYISGLLNSTNMQVFLIIKVEATNQFTQLTKNKNGVQLDFPLVTDEQKSRKQDIIKIGEQLKLNLISNIGTNGVEFLDFGLEGDSEFLANAIEQVLTRLYKIDKNTDLEFQTNGYYIQPT